MLMVGALDYGHFYRAAFWRGEPRTAKPFISSLNVVFGGASASTSFNSQGEKVPLLAIFGHEDLKELGVIPAHMARPCKDLSFAGQFSLLEMQLDYVVNLDNGFFGQLHFPVRSFLLSDIRPSQTTGKCERASEALFNDLKHHALELKTINKTGFGDLTILGGWAGSSSESTTFDFIDVSGRIGVLFPTASRGEPCNGNLCNIMSLGQGGAFAFPVSASAAVGFLNWLSCGVYGLGLFFLNGLICPFCAQAIARRDS